MPRAAAPIGAWSAISSSDPPARTQSRTASHSGSVNAGLEAVLSCIRSAPSAFEMTSTSYPAREAGLKAARFGVTTQPSWAIRSANTL